MGRLSDNGPATIDDLARQLKIKVGVAKRLTKEVASYENEAVAQEQKIADMRERGQDIYDIKKQEEVLQESYMMIPDSKARLQAAVEDLEAFVTEHQEVKGLQESDILAEATALVNQATTAATATTTGI
ncbi:tubulin-specific chaperone a [Nannochloropsis oceanica]